MDYKKGSYAYYFSTYGVNGRAYDGDTGWKEIVKTIIND